MTKKYWYAFLNSVPRSVLTMTALDFMVAPFIHCTFLVLYYLIHEKKIIDFDQLFETMKNLILADLFLFLPICYTNFKFIPVGIWQTVYINSMYVIVVEPVGSIIINDDVGFFEVFSINS
jgi:hypothetical protein